MRGRFTDQGGLFSYIAPDKRVPANHPLRKVRELVRDVLSDLNRSLGRLYASEGRPSIPPEQLLSALLLQVFYGIRSERQLMEQLDYNLLYRWFVGLSPDDPVWDPTTFTKNRERLQNGDVFTKFMTKASEPFSGQTAIVGRAFFGGRNADRGLGFTEELSSQGRQR
jgi:transposase